MLYDNLFLNEVFIYIKEIYDSLIEYYMEFMNISVEYVILLFLKLTFSN